MILDILHGLPKLDICILILICGDQKALPSSSSVSFQPAPNVKTSGGIYTVVILRITVIIVFASYELLVVST